MDKIGGLGSGCVACEVRGTGAVTVSAAIDASGGKQGGLGGKVSMTGGGDLTVGPGPITFATGSTRPVKTTRATAFRPAPIVGTASALRSAGAEVAFGPRWA